jgi:hypothetical protein
MNMTAISVFNYAVTRTGTAWIILAVTALLAGCAGSRSADAEHEYLDVATGITLMGLHEPAIFHHDDRRLAANVRDYLYVGPVEMNRMGKHSWYLWLGEWSTIDRVPSGQAAATADKDLDEVVVLLDGVPMELPDRLEAGDKSRIIQHPYDLPVASMRTAYMRVSRDQLNKIAAAKSIAIRVGDAGAVRSYKLWSGNIDAFGLKTKDAAAENSERLVNISD